MGLYPWILLETQNFFELNNVDQKIVRSLLEKIAEHKKKLAEYIKDPFKYDNKEILKNAPSDEIGKKIIEGRIRHLMNEINNWEQQIKNLLK